MKTRNKVRNKTRSVTLHCGSNPTYWHRIDGPCFIIYKTPERKKIKNMHYWLHDNKFYPWWLNEI